MEAKPTQTFFICFEMEFIEIHTSFIDNKRVLFRQYCNRTSNIM